VWIYYDRRDHALFEAERRKLTFHCIRCGQLYTAKSRRGTAACPQCGHSNTRLRF
jgi:Zn finger protein HypA/HybF involved in hydrogenase expression